MNLCSSILDAPSEKTAVISIERNQKVNIHTKAKIYISITGKTKLRLLSVELAKIESCPNWRQITDTENGTITHKLCHRKTLFLMRRPGKQNNNFTLTTRQKINWIPLGTNQKHMDLHTTTGMAIIITPVTTGIANTLGRQLVESDHLGKLANSSQFSAHLSL